MRVSIVIPVLNEAALITTFLRQLRTVAPDAEVIVVDGGSRDDTVELSRSLANRVIIATPSRGRQMSSGAAAGSGDVFWFVHADSHIPADAVSAMTNCLLNPNCVGGCFRLRIVPRRWIYRIRDFVGDVCVDVFKIGLGDRGLFCRRDSFQAVGGYGDELLFEDADLYRNLARLGKMRRLAPAIETSARRYEAQGPIRTCLFYGFVMLLYWAGLRRRTLERLVERFRSLAIKESKMRASSDLSRSNTLKGALPRSAPLHLNPNL